MRTTLSKIYSIYGSDVLENFKDRMTGRDGEAAQRKAASETVQAFVKARYGDKAVARWSRKLGCGCGCSPGWRVSMESNQTIDECRNANDAWARPGRWGGMRPGGRRRWQPGGCADFFLEIEQGKFIIRRGSGDAIAPNATMWPEMVTP